MQENVPELESENCFSGCGAPKFAQGPFLAEPSMKTPESSYFCGICNVTAESYSEQTSKIAQPVAELPFYRASYASAVFGVVILSVRPSVRLSVTRVL